jgi:hypothetical protein
MVRGNCDLVRGDRVPGVGRDRPATHPNPEVVMMIMERIQEWMWEQRLSEPQIEQMAQIAQMEAV